MVFANMKSVKLPVCTFMGFPQFEYRFWLTFGAEESHGLDFGGSGHFIEKTSLAEFQETCECRKRATYNPIA